MKITLDSRGTVQRTSGNHAYQDMLLFKQENLGNQCGAYRMILLCEYVYMKILLKEVQVECIQNLFHAPTECDEDANYELRD